MGISDLVNVWHLGGELDIQPEIIARMRDRFRELKESGKLHHGSGTFDYGDWAVWL